MLNVVTRPLTVGRSKFGRVGATRATEIILINYILEKNRLFKYLRYYELLRSVNIYAIINLLYWDLYETRRTT